MLSSSSRVASSYNTNIQWRKNAQLFHLMNNKKKMYTNELTLLTECEDTTDVYVLRCRDVCSS